MSQATQIGMYQRVKRLVKVIGTRFVLCLKMNGVKLVLDFLFDFLCGANIWNGMDFERVQGFLSRARVHVTQYGAVRSFKHEQHQMLALFEVSFFLSRW